ncbi:class I SAM-dependent methyltransferase [Herbiconiux ginsengi]|uniref:Methyltransferase domain-containing protein n=1 Tax=Herbiconiux ginsengi TaxID=381665 RepID=A0A1H3KJ47_9MICO|nr:class I SAM-dependent methyltransferase [Herbiconiux ginsengi]SDY52136.1 Methyltransferase domain-containing protein [Herbiconiux ginsengi]
MSENTETDATAFWEGRYREREQIWSGRPNRALVDVIESIGTAPGRALDLGSGEGADSIWLAEQEWQVTGVEISATAISRARVHASDRGVSDRITWQQADLAEWMPAAEYELVSACFLHSPVAFPREAVLRQAASAVAPGGHLLVVGHASFPPWSRHAAVDAADAHGQGQGHDREGGNGVRHAHSDGTDPESGASHAHGHDDGDLPTPEQVREQLALPVGAWETVIAENRSREATGPDGQHAVLDDAILLLRRLV